MFAVWIATTDAAKGSIEFGILSPNFQMLDGVLTQASG
jgi:hypothetical protein